MEIDMLTVETDCILQDMQKIKKVCSEAYTQTDSVDDKVKIQMMYEGKIFEKVKLFFSSLVVGLGKTISHLEDLDRAILSIPSSMVDRAVIAAFQRDNTLIKNYQEFDRKAFLDLWHKMNVTKSMAKLKAAKEIDLDDSDIKELLANAKNISALRKQWATELMTPKRDVRYSQIGAHNRKNMVSFYRTELESTKKNIKSIQNDIKEIEKKSKGDPNTMKVARAAVIVAKAITNAIVSAINKDIAIQKKIYRNTGSKLVTL